MTNYIQLQNNYKITEAIVENNFMHIERLIKEDELPLDYISPSGDNLLLYALKYSRRYLSYLLLDYYAGISERRLKKEVNYINSRGQRPLMMTISNRDCELTSRLIIDGADPNFMMNVYGLKEDRKCPAFHLIVKYFDIKTIETFYEYGGDINMLDEEGHTVFYKLLSHNEKYNAIAIIELLGKWGINLENTSNSSHSMYNIAKDCLGIEIENGKYAINLWGA